VDRGLIYRLTRASLVEFNGLVPRLLLKSSFLILLAGCGSGKFIQLTPPNNLSLKGSVLGGQLPLVGSELRLYATGSTGDGSTSTALLSQSFQTDGNGEFTISAAYKCPSASSQVYIVATGGKPYLSSSASNPSIALMATLGSCGNLNSVPSITVNEVTTVGSIWPFAPYAKTVSQIGSGNADAQDLNAASETTDQLISVRNGTAPGPTLTAGQIAPTAKLYSLASMIAACVNSSGGTVGDGTACGRLFSASASAGVPPPIDTIGAALAIAQNPTRNVVEIFNLCPIDGAFQPALSSPPDDWTLPILSLPSPPTISPGTGTIPSGQKISIADNTPDAVVYYTMDGSLPSTASKQYSGPIALTSSTTVSAVAVKSGLRSAVVSSVFSVVASVAVALTPSNANLSPARSQVFIATVSGTSNSAVTWSLSPVVGSISAAGLYTAPASITSPQTVRVTTTSVANPAMAASAIVSLTPPVSVALTPGIATLSPSQSQMFTAAVAGSSNKTVTWSLSPAVGSISAVGLYTAPSTISMAQTVTVTTTSVADTTKHATASISLVPPVSVVVSPGSMSLSSSQTQQFSATVTNSSNTAVTWSISPAVGSISARGIYTAPVTITTAQTVTVKATSVANTAAKATAAVSLVQPRLVFVTEPGASVAGAPMSPGLSVAFEDANGNVLTGGSGAVTLQLGSNPGVASLDGTLTVAAVNGVATFPAVTVSSAGTGYTVLAESSGSGVATSTPFTVTNPALSLSLPASTVSTGSTMTGTVTLSQPAAIPVTVTLTSFAPGLLSVSPSLVSIAAGQTSATFVMTGVAVGTATVNATALGYLMAAATVADVVPAIPASFFGMTTQNFAQVTPTVSYGTTRSWDGTGLDWPDLNPAPGVYNFAALDAFIAQNQARGVDMIYTFGRTPLWASSNLTAASHYAPGQCAPPANIAYWENFVTAIVTHAAGRIKYWELWNEPNDLESWCGSSQALVTLAAQAYPIIKSLDPAASVLSPAYTETSGAQGLSSYLSAGGNRYLDIVAFHGYSTISVAEKIVALTTAYQNVMVATGLGNKPIFDTETSWSNTSTAVPMETQVGFTAKTYLLQWSLGVQRFVWYAWDGSDIWGQLWTSAGGPTAAATAYQQTYDWMAGASMPTPCTEASNSVWTCTLTRPGGYSAEALWITNSPATITVPNQYVQYQDLTGAVHPIVGHSVTVGDWPILVETGNLP
jgi:hypothetical protein